MSDEATSPPVVVSEEKADDVEPTPTPEESNSTTPAAVADQTTDDAAAVVVAATTTTTEPVATTTTATENNVGGAGEEEDNATAVEEENTTANFAPVVQLEEVEVRSGEEEENVLYTARTKLFVYGETMLDKGTGIKNWIERGVGDVRILQHRTSGHIRLLMRQEKTLKIICNHQIDPRIELTPNIGNDRSWVWQAYDYSDGVELIETMFAIRFKDTEMANGFKLEFEKCQLENKKFYDGLDATDTTAGDAIAEAFVGISTTDTNATPDE